MSSTVQIKVGVTVDSFNEAAFASDKSVVEPAKIWLYNARYHV